MDYKILSRNLLSKEAFWQVNKAIARLTDNDTAILLADLISKEEYFENRNQMNGEYFFNTVQNIKDDTNISKDRQLICLKKLKHLGIVETKTMLVPRKKHYKINHEKLFLVLSETNKINNCRKTRRLKSVKHDNQMSQNTTTINKNKVNENKLNKNKEDLKHIDIFSKNVCVDENIKGKFYADEGEMKSDFNKYINDFNLTTSGEVFIFELIEEFYRNLLYIKNIKHGLITEEVMKKCISVIIDNYAEYDLLDDYILYVREYFKSNRKYYSFQDFCNANTLRILSERCVKGGK